MIYRLRVHHDSRFVCDKIMYFDVIKSIPVQFELSAHSKLFFSDFSFFPPETLIRSFAYSVFLMLSNPPTKTNMNLNIISILGPFTGVIMAYGG